MAIAKALIYIQKKLLSIFYIGINVLSLACLIEIFNKMHILEKQKKYYYVG